MAKLGFSSDVATGIATGIATGRNHRWVGVVAMVAALLAVPSFASAKSTGTTETAGAPASKRELNKVAKLPPRSATWWQRGFLVDYGVIALGGLAIALPGLADSPNRAAIGPDYNPDNPGLLLDPANANATATISRPYLQQNNGETVPTAVMAYALGGGFGWLALQETVPWLRGSEPNARRLHDTLVGYVEGLALTLGMVEILKVGVGRLRPDFADRARRYHCQVGDVKTLQCTGVAPLDPDLAEAKWLLRDGQKSFPSGHAATAMYLSSYLSFAIGGRYVWSDDASFTSRSFGLLAQGMALSAGVFVAASRFDDGRHHLSDVLTGGALGLGFATFSYWRRFDSRGRIRARGSQPTTAAWRLTTGPTARGVGVYGRF